MSSWRTVFGIKKRKGREDRGLRECTAPIQVAVPNTDEGLERRVFFVLSVRSLSEDLMSVGLTKPCQA